MDFASAPPHVRDLGKFTESAPLPDVMHTIDHHLTQARVAMDEATWKTGATISEGLQIMFAGLGRRLGEGASD